MNLWCWQPESIEDYADLHASPITTPDSVHDYEQDDAFARQRLQGKSFASGIMVRKHYYTALFGLHYSCRDLEATNCCRFDNVPVCICVFGPVYLPVG